ncbi:hypothetical protein [Muriicola sp. Z0-33]|uniref:hypothetical protein n=1 Tax=Muriicola sp. Z0-33 TaxID=2816957 RepID=UPI00223727CC|nr:hypothetical protein [Muriicola sp. Z0-33]MCW5516421.1 hypothetical protein [Muriicola sp. Z0-33]
MIYPLTDKQLGTLELDIGFFRFYPNLVVSEMKEGVVVNFDNCLPLFIKALEYYTTDTPLIYISNRINSYSFDPTLHLEAKTVYSNLKGYGVVVYDEMNYRIALLEQKFMDCPVNIFYSIEEAKIWASKLLMSTQ